MGIKIVDSIMFEGQKAYEITCDCCGKKAGQWTYSQTRHACDGAIKHHGFLMADDGAILCSMCQTNYKPVSYHWVGTKK